MFIFLVGVKHVAVGCKRQCYIQSKLLVGKRRARAHWKATDYSFLCSKLFSSDSFDTESFIAVQLGGISSFFFWIVENSFVLTCFKNSSLVDCLYRKRILKKS